MKSFCITDGQCAFNQLGSAKRRQNGYLLRDKGNEKIWLFDKRGRLWESRTKPFRWRRNEGKSRRRKQHTAIVLSSALHRNHSEKYPGEPDNYPGKGKRINHRVLEAQDLSMSLLPKSIFSYYHLQKTHDSWTEETPLVLYMQTWIRFKITFQKTQIIYSSTTNL